MFDFNTAIMAGTILLQAVLITALHNTNRSNARVVRGALRQIDEHNNIIDDVRRNMVEYKGLVESTLIENATLRAALQEARAGRHAPITAPTHPSNGSELVLGHMVPTPIRYIAGYGGNGGSGCACKHITDGSVFYPAPGQRHWPEVAIEPGMASYYGESSMNSSVAGSDGGDA